MYSWSGAYKHISAYFWQCLTHNQSNGGRIPSIGACVCLDIYECLYVYKHIEFVGPYTYTRIYVEGLVVVMVDVLLCLFSGSLVMEFWWHQQQEQLWVSSALFGTPPGWIFVPVLDSTLCVYAFDSAVWIMGTTEVLIIMSVNNKQQLTHNQNTSLPNTSIRNSLWVTSICQQQFQPS